MKLVLKRAGADPRSVIPLSDFGRRVVDHRPFALHDEQGSILPCQVSTSTGSDSDGSPILTVVFRMDGQDLLIQGDYQASAERS